MSTNKNIIDKNSLNSNDQVDNQVLSKYFSFKCNEYKDSMIKCFDKLDKKYFFKKSMLKKCEKIEKTYINCLLSNNLKSVTTEVSIVKELNQQRDVQIKETKDILMSKLDYTEGKVSVDDLKSKLVQNVKLKEL